MASQQHRPGAPTTPVPAGDEAVVDLHETFMQLRRRHSRLGGMVRRREAEAEDLTRRGPGKITRTTARERVGYHDVWSQWSESYDNTAKAADRLLRSPPRSLADVLMLFNALEWALLADGVIVDHAAEGQVRRFSRDLRRLVAGR
jgi:hypothetical protein